MMGFKLPFASAAPKVVTEVVELRIYPVKSCRGIKLDSWQLTTQGLDLDRRWMFADAKTKKFVTIRDFAKMTLIDITIVTPTDDESGRQMLQLAIRGTDIKVRIPARPTVEWLDDNTHLETVNIWGADTDGHAYGDEINKPFSEFLEREVMLLYKGPTERVVDEVPGRKATVNFPDFMQVLIANEASIRELNSRLKSKGVDPITIERFRPNIIVKGFVEGEVGSSSETTSTDPDVDATLRPKPWSEDNWKSIRIINKPNAGGISSYIGSNSLDIDVCAYCARCLVPNVDPDTAEKHPKEPWDTLVSYRRVDPSIKYKPCFGMLSAPRNAGPISVGMRFEVTALKNES